VVATNDVGNIKKYLIMSNGFNESEMLTTDDKHPPHQTWNIEDAKCMTQSIFQGGRDVVSYTTTEVKSAMYPVMRGVRFDETSFLSTSKTGWTDY
jgi:hypothetical protein